VSDVCIVRGILRFQQITNGNVGESFSKVYLNAIIIESKSKGADNEIFSAFKNESAGYLTHSIHKHEIR
jgi:hypothetical protein